MSELSNEEKQRSEQAELQKLESKQSLLAEKPKGLFASIVASVKRFANRRSIAMEKSKQKKRKN